ncbi:Transcriptional regulator ure2 [Elasticomyces elasticus]|nr:Transcriptional regulator ure2 [Elasticomyces elasticus]
MQSLQMTQTVSLTFIEALLFNRPYFGQAVWFKVYHPEQNLTSAIDRYNGEIKRVLGVIDAHLAKTGKPYLVGDKVSFVDLMFVPWNHIAPFCLGEGSEAELEKSLPLMWAWRQRLEARESVKAAYAEIEKLKAEQGAGSH